MIALKYDPNSETVKENVNLLGFIKMFKNNYAKQLWQKYYKAKENFNNLKKKFGTHIIDKGLAAYIV